MELNEVKLAIIVVIAILIGNSVSSLVLLLFGYSATQILFYALSANVMFYT